MNELESMLGLPRSVVFSKRAVLRAPIRSKHAGRNSRVVGCRRKRRAIRRRRDAVGAREAGRERADAPESDGEADLDNGAVGCAKQRRGALQSARQQVGMRRLAESASELTTEMRAREACGTSQVVDIEWLGVGRIDQVPGPQEVALGRNDAHRHQSAGKRSRRSMPIRSLRPLCLRPPSHRGERRGTPMRRHRLRGSQPASRSRCCSTRRARSPFHQVRSPD